MRHVFLKTIFISAISYMITNNLFATEHLAGVLDRNNLPEQVRHYVDTLPKIDRKAVSMTSDEKSKSIVEFLKTFFPTTNQSSQILKNLKGEDALAKHILRYLEEERTVWMRISAFPFKSINKEKKVLGCYVDMGDFVGLLTLHHICREIGIIHQQGAKIVIFSDGVAFKDILDITEGAYRCYQDSLKRLIEAFDVLKFVSPSQVTFQQFLKEEDIIPKNTKIEQDKLKALKTFVKNEIDFTNPWYISPFLISVILPILPFIHMNITIQQHRWGIASNKAKGCTADTIARSLHDRSIAFDHFLKRNFRVNSKNIRLSVHPYENISQKCGISLIYGSRGTPWHGVLVLNKETVVLDNKLSVIKHLKRTDFHNRSNPSTPKLPIRYYYFNGIDLPYLYLPSYEPT